MFTAAWMAIKAFAAPLLEALVRVLSDPRVIMVLAAAVAGWALYGAGKTAGYNEAELVRKDGVIDAQAGRLDDNDKIFQNIDQRLGEIAGDAARRAREGAARDLQLGGFIEEMGKHAPDARCLFTVDDVRLLGTLDKPPATGQ
tara:strand:+ start:7919 stop:8347 length:429 start_codon:yes stop_codon:yes gene_type:complete